MNFIGNFKILFKFTRNLVCSISTPFFAIVWISFYFAFIFRVFLTQKYRSTAFGILFLSFFHAWVKHHFSVEVRNSQIHIGIHSQWREADGRKLSFLISRMTLFYFLHSTRLLIIKPRLNIHFFSFLIFAIRENHGKCNFIHISLLSMNCQPRYESSSFVFYCPLVGLFDNFFNETLAPICWAFRGLQKETTPPKPEPKIKIAPECSFERTATIRYARDTRFFAFMKAKAVLIKVVELNRKKELETFFVKWLISPLNSPTRP